jgi:hypothetical protein
MQVQATALKKQLLQQLGVKPEHTQQLISRHPSVLEFRVDSLIEKATEQGQLLDVEAADVVVKLWTRNDPILRTNTQVLQEKLHAKLAQLLLQPYMSPADMRQMVLSQLRILVGTSTDAVQARLAALQECLPDWSPRQLGAALVTYPTVLMRSPETIRYKWRIASQYSGTYTLGPLKQQEQQQGPPHRASVLGLFQCPAERYALLEYILQQQQAQSSLSSTGGSVSTSSLGLNSCSDGGAHSTHVPPMLTVLHSKKQPFERLLQERCRGFQQWNKQRQLAVKRQGQQLG